MHCTETATLELWRIVELENRGDSILHRSDVHIQTLESKKSLLGPYLSVPKEKVSQAIIENLHRRSIPLANTLVIKPFHPDQLVFRLVNKRNLDATEENSYIALSYRWTKAIAAHMSELKGEIFIPTSSEMFQAVLNEKYPSNEGLWFDQICIDQNDQDEKGVSIGVMDTIYKGARIVVVALDDVNLNKCEGIFLRNHCMVAGLDSRQFFLDSFNRSFREEKSTYATYVQENPQILKILSKILYSEYFDRAWCNHELRLGREVVFLARMNDDTLPQRHTFVRMTTTSLYVLWKLALAGDPELFTRLISLRPGLFDFIQAKVNFAGASAQTSLISQAKRQTFSLQESIMSIWQLKTSGNPFLPPQDRLLDANLDRISIILNVCGLSLSLRSHAEITIKEATTTACYGLLFAIGQEASNAYLSAQRQREVCMLRNST